LNILQIPTIADPTTAQEPIVSWGRRILGRLERPLCAAKCPAPDGARMGLSGNQSDDCKIVLVADPRRS